jgi:hypothetical protein
VTGRTRSWCGRMIRAATLVTIAALIPLPAAASDTATTPSPPTIRKSMEKISVRDVAAKPVRKDVARDDRQGSSAGSSPGFFKTKPGIIALAVMGAGVGYALYSAQNDRIHSPGKK